jgi:hypothetical protein
MGSFGFAGLEAMVFKCDIERVSVSELSIADKLGNLVMVIRTAIMHMR